MLEAAADFHLSSKFSSATAVEYYGTFLTAAFGSLFNFVKRGPPRMLHAAFVNLAICTLADAIAFRWSCRPCYVKIIIAVTPFHLDIELSVPSETERDEKFPKSDLREQVHLGAG